MSRALICALLLSLPFTANAIVIRDDVQDSAYRIPASEFPALADMPHEGHGVLIAPQWVVTAAHAVTWQHEVTEITLAGKPRKVERIVLHPGYRKLPQAIIDAALASGDATAAMQHLASSDDIALIKLAEPVSDVAPVRIFRGDALGKDVRIIGKGATGTGVLGHSPHGPNRTELRHAFNTISIVDGRWLGYVFDKPGAALPLEGISGNGDSGSPVLVADGEEWQLAGLASWKPVNGNPATFRPGVYGQTSYAIRVALYAAWMDATMADATSDAPEIRAVIESFRTAILQKDRARFLALFVQPDLPWQSVMDDASLARVKRKRPDAIKARYKQDNNPVAFIDGIVKSSNTSEETFSNIRIDADGDVAAVSFDYTFLSNGRQTNSGQESWLMVRTEAGWKITTLAYSVKLAPAPDER